MLSQGFYSYGILWDLHFFFLIRNIRYSDLDWWTCGTWFLQALVSSQIECLVIAQLSLNWVALNWQIILFFSIGKQ